MSNSWIDMPVLKGDVVQLRPLQPGDADGIVAAAADGRLWELFYTSVPSADTIDAYIEKAMADRRSGRAMPFVVMDRTSQRIVGATRYMRMNRDARRLEIGTTFYAQSAQRSAVNSEAKLLLLTHAFETMDCLCVQLRTDAFNFPSQRAIERLGAKKDGMLRNHSIVDGRVRDTMVYSILASEWPGAKENLQMYRDRR